MTKHPGDQTPEPEGGRAAERLRQFRQARQPAPAPEEDTEQAGQGAARDEDARHTGQGVAPDEATSHGADESAIHKDRDN
jgi:hypothetical protein